MGQSPSSEHPQGMDITYGRRHSYEPNTVSQESENLIGRTRIASGSRGRPAHAPSAPLPQHFTVGGVCPYSLHRLISSVTPQAWLIRLGCFTGRQGVRVNPSVAGVLPTRTVLILVRNAPIRALFQPILRGAHSVWPSGWLGGRLAGWMAGWLAAGTPIHV